MEGTKTVDDLLKAKKLTPDEQRQLREIIEECRAREAQIKEVSDATKRNLENLERTFGAIIETIGAVGASMDALYQEVERLQLKLMPEENFFHE
jgi:hypothetical protein